MSIASDKLKIATILGPTASGKSDLAVKLAKKFNGEVVSADSRQIYKGMDIGTGKITKQEMRGVPHHLLNAASPKNTFTVARFQKLGTQAIEKVLKRGKLPIVCGGTGFYIDALIYGYKLPAVKANKALREKLEKKDAEQLFKLLKKLDPKRARNIDRFNKRRLVRAIEIVMETGQPVPPKESRLKYAVLKIGIKMPSGVLRERIAKRLRARMRKGMAAEVNRLHEKGLSWKRMEELGLEYRWVSRYLRGLIGKEEMLEKLETEIWRYAKRQMTWFRRDKNIKWVENLREAEGLVKNFLK